jgi:hypothetical protein
MFVDTKLRPQGEQHKVGTLKLSEAIRIGAKLRPQCRGNYFEDGKSCVLGAAWEGAGFDDEAPYDYMYQVLWKFGINRLASLIASKNDAGESRESIADWLESQGL